jgi:hypothetical protein
MNKDFTIIKFNRKLAMSFIFVCIIFLVFFLITIFPPLDDKKHSAFYQFGGLLFTILLLLPVVISYGRHFFNKKIAFYLDDSKFIYNNPLVDVPNPILWDRINNIKKIELGNYQFIAISFYDNAQYINQLNPFWKYIANFRLKKFGFPLMINENDMVDTDFDHLLKLFNDSYENNKISNKSLERNI